MVLHEEHLFIITSQLTGLKGIPTKTFSYLPLKQKEDVAVVGQGHNQYTKQSSLTGKKINNVWEPKAPFGSFFLIFDEL